MWHIRNIIVILNINLLLVFADDSKISSASTKATTLTVLPSCNEKDENINDCLLKLFSEIIPRAKNGIPEINIPPTDPLAINKTRYIFSHPLVQGKLALSNIKIHGLSKAVTKSLDYKRKGEEVFFKVKYFIPEMFVEGMYKAKIKINTANISSKGAYNVTLTNIDTDIQSTGNFYERDGHRYIRIKTFNFDPTVGDLKFYAEGLLPEPLLNEAINEFINQNWRSIYKNLIPETRAAWEPEFVKLSNDYLYHVTVDAILKDD